VVSQHRTIIAAGDLVAFVGNTGQCAGDVTEQARTIQGVDHQILWGTGAAVLGGHVGLDLGGITGKPGFNV